MPLTRTGGRDVIPGVLLAGKAAAAGLAGWTLWLVEADSGQQANGQLALYLALVSLGVAGVTALPQVIGLFRRPPKPSPEELEKARLDLERVQAELAVEQLRHQQDDP